MKNIAIWTILVLVLTTAVYSQTFYIDEDIVLDSDGTAYIIGNTNLDILSIIEPDSGRIEGYTQELTLKEGLLWKFVYKTENNISAINIDVVLPKFAEIQAVDTNLDTSISIKSDRHVIRIEGENAPLDIEIGYVVANATIKKESSILAQLLFGTGVILIIIGIILLYSKFKKKSKRINTKDISKSESTKNKVKEDNNSNKENTKIKEENQEENSNDTKDNKKILNLDNKKLETLRLTINENQLKILDALIEKKGEASQTTLKYLTGIPKSSLSRNIELMSQKSVISKFYNGTSNHIKIHPSLYKNQEI